MNYNKNIYMPIFKLKDLQEKWDKYRIKLNKDYNRCENISITCIMNNPVIEYINETINNIYNIIDSNVKEGILFGSIDDNNIEINSCCSNYEINKDYSILGSPIGYLYTIPDLIMTNKILLICAQILKENNLTINNIIILLKNETSIEAYLINKKLIELYNDKILSTNEDTNYIISDIDIEIFENNKITVTKELPIELFYKPVKIK